MQILETIEKVDGVSYETLVIKPEKQKSNKQIMFIHGWGLPVKAYSLFLQETSLKTQLQVKALNLPGFGKSSSLGSKTSEINFIQQLSNYIANHGNDKISHFIGHSFGSYLLLKLLIENKITNKGEIILFNPLGLHKKNFTHYKELSTSLLSEVVNSNLNRLKDGGVEILKNPVNIGKTATLALNSEIVNTELEQIPKKINLIIGENDKITPIHNLETLYKNPKIEIIQTPGNHGWMLKNTEESSNIVANILKIKNN
jgi:surfactin synthase thioesterase subunit